MSLLKDDAHAPLPAGSSNKVSILEVESLLPFSAGAPYGVRPARPGSYLDFEK